jgi:hypothetical protein
LSQELVLAVQAPCDLGHEVFRHPQGSEGLLEDLSGVLRLAPITLEALVRCKAAALSGFGVFFAVSFRWRHTVLLYRVPRVSWVNGVKDTVSPEGRACPRGDEANRALL